MIWFKHFCDNHRGKSQQIIYENFGHTGIACYYILLELCAEKLNKKSTEKFTEHHVKFEFHKSIIRQNFKTSWTKVELMLNQYQTLDLLFWTKNQSIVKIEIPILLDLLDSDHKRTRQRRGKDASWTPLELELEKELEVEVVNTTTTPSKKESWFEAFSFKTFGDLGLAMLSPKVEKAFIEEKNFEDWVNGVMSSKKAQELLETNKLGAKRYFVKALNDELKLRGIL